MILFSISVHVLGKVLMRIAISLQVQFFDRRIERLYVHFPTRFRLVGECLHGIQRVRDV